MSLSDHAYASPFGTFLCDCEFERRRLGLKERTASLWSRLNHPDILEGYLNCLYEPNRGVIWPSVAPISLVRATVATMTTSTTALLATTTTKKNNSTKN